VPTGVPVKLNGYIDWSRGDHLIVEGQRVRWTANTRLAGLAPSALPSAPAGLEAKVTGLRTADGTVWAHSIELKKNGLALFEKEVIAMGRSQEEGALRAGAFVLPVDGKLKPIGIITTSGADVERCRRIMARLLPPAHRSMPSIYVVESNIWNAMVMPNGSVWVFRGLLSDVRSDDELAVVLGHELAHYTHEHQRKAQKQNVWIKLAEFGAVAAIGRIDDPVRYEAAKWGAIYALNAWSNGYDRSHESQADRVGLRYAFEGGFDVTAGPGVWQRKAAEGDPDRFTAFFFATHPRSETRMEALQREIAYNYVPSAVAR
jgi:Zn-dependent protease with chaperone function